MRRLLNNVLVSLVVTILAGCGGDVAPAADPGEGGATGARAPAIDAAPATADVAAAGGHIDPETATREELMTVPQIDPELADVIIAARPYQDMTEVDDVLDETLSEEERQEVYRRLWKRLDLNTATAEEILLIPGIGNRMLHEFEEYRPYRAIEQFRREMGKYVDDEEVARMEQYVEVR